MVQRKSPPPPRPAEVNPAEMREALPKLERRIAESQAFDVNTVNERTDPKIGALRNKIDDLLVSIFSNDTIEYRRYQVFDLVDASIIIGQRLSSLEVREALKDGIERAISKLETIRGLFIEKLEDLGGSPTGKARRAFGDLDMHPELQEAVGKLFSDGHFANAVEDGCK